VKNKGTIALILVVGLAAVYGVYWFRTSRLTAASYIEFEEQQQRIAAVEKQSEAQSQYRQEAATDEAETAASSKRRAESAAVLAEAKAASNPLVTPNDAAARVNEAPPEVTIIPNESMPEETPATFSVLFETTKGPFAVQFTRDWAPNGADRVYQLVREKFFTDMRVFRAVENFVIQFGIPGDPKVSQVWDGKDIADDPVKQSNTEGMFTFAATGAPNSRSTQVFVNLSDNPRLDGMGFAPVGKVIFGLDTAKSLYSGYGDSISDLQAAITAEGNAFLDKNFPELDSIKRAVFVEAVYDPNPAMQRQREEIKRALGGGAVSAVVDERAPDSFKVKLDCTMGSFTVECTRAWSPVGADRFYTLVKKGFFNDAKFFRVVPDFIVQFGLPADPEAHAEIANAMIPDDTTGEKNVEGTMVFAKSAKPNSRSTQIFININDNTGSLDPQGFTPFGKIIEGMDVVKQINPEYGEQPSQRSIKIEGNHYLNNDFPRLDGIKSATLVE